MPGDIFVNTVGVILYARFARASSMTLAAVVADVSENTVAEVKVYIVLSTQQRSVHFSAVLCMRSTCTISPQQGRFAAIASYR